MSDFDMDEGYSDLEFEDDGEGNEGDAADAENQVRRGVDRWARPWLFAER